MIDITKLSRDYNNNPLKAGEYICYNDLYYLYITLNCTKKELSKFFKISISKIEKSLSLVKINKSPELYLQRTRQTNLAKYGTDNLFKDVARMTQARKEKLGVEHALQRADLLKKSQDTLESHFGVRTTFKSKEILTKKDKTNLERWGTIHPTQNQEIKNKMVETNLKRWGYVSTSLNPKIKKKQQDTLEKHYGVRQSPFASKEIQEKVKQINKQKYGKEIYRKSQDFKDKQKQALNVVGEDGLTNLERRTKTYKENCLKKYGVENYTQSKEYQKIVKQVQEKRYATMKEHNSFNYSAPEEEIYNLLINKFGKEDIIRQYKSEKYPYKCDFYIKSSDLYIECHFNWTHEFEPFDEKNIEHQQKVAQLIEDSKESKYYSKALYVWTVLDVAKLKCFKENKLSYKIFYNKEQFNSWFQNI